MKCIGQLSFCTNLLSGHIDRNTHRTDCSTWTTKVVGNSMTLIVVDTKIIRPISIGVGSPYAIVMPLIVLFAMM